MPQGPIMLDMFTPSDSYEQALDRAAKVWGIEPSYGDTWGRVHVTSPETKKGILRALGISPETKEDLDRAVEQRLAREWGRLAPPVAVIGTAAFTEGFPVYLPERHAGGPVSIEIRWEQGGVERRTLAPGDLRESGRLRIGGDTYVRKQVPLADRSPLGYHNVTVSAAGRKARLRLILCPDRAYEPAAVQNGSRAAGLAIALYGLRSRRNWGCGDFTDLEALIDWAAEDAGIGFIGLNPLHAIPNRLPFNISPYLPVSTFYKNPLYLDLDRIETFRDCPRARRWRESVAAEVEELRGARFVAYERVWALKLHGLKLAFARFLHDRHNRRDREFRDWAEAEGELLERYAVWCALDEWIHRRNPNVWVWTGWPEEYRDPESEAVAAFAKKHWRSVLFYKWLQWEIEAQLAAAQAYARRKGLAIGLYHDLALATDRCGSDLWAWRPLYVSGCRVGAPPDEFSPLGQDWSFPPPDSAHHRETGYRMFVESIRKNLKHGGALRMDHVMRFFRLYWIPEGLAPNQGAYVRDHAEDLLHILALESVRNKVILVGEDLGTVTKTIRRALDRFGLYGYKVPYFEKKDSGELKLPSEYAEQALVSSSTHDLPTLAGFWIGRDIDCRVEAGLLPDAEDCRRMWADREREKQKFLDAFFRLGLLPDWYPRRAGDLHELTGELHNAFVGWLAQAPSRLLALNQEDLLKDAEQQNLPATNSEQYPNWMHKMGFSVEELRTNAYARDVTRMFRDWVERTGRANQPALAEHA